MGPPLLCTAVAGRRSIGRVLEPAESLRAKLGGRDLQTSCRASVRRYFKTQLDVLMPLRKVRPGFRPGAARPTCGDAGLEAATSVELAQFCTAHFATHGVLAGENPGMSGIMLSMFDGQGRPQDGFLRLHDIDGLRLPAERVVLRACSTALGRQARWRPPFCWAAYPLHGEWKASDGS